MRWWVVIVVLVAVAVAAGAAHSASGQTNLPHSLVIVSPTKISLTTKGTPGQATATVVVRNDGAAVDDLTFKAVGKDGDKIAVEVDKTSIDTNTAAPVTLTFKPTDADLKFSGVLLATAADSAPGTVTMSLAPEKSARWWLYLVILLPLLVGGVLVIIRWMTFHEAGCGLKSRVGPANWDFSKSWGSNLTVVGALLGTILSSSALPEQMATSKATYAGLNLLFGVLILVAPLVYTATQTPNSVHRTKLLKEPQYQGYVASLLVASAVTLWAVIGELTTVVLLFEEIRTSRSLPVFAIVLLVVLVAAAAALLCFYAFRALGWILKRQCDVATLKTETHSELVARYGAAAPAEEAVDPARPEWSLL